MNYAPEPTGIGPYTAELAQVLVHSGERVRVVTTFPHYPSWTIAPGDRHLRRREIIDGVEVNRLWTRMPRPMTGTQRSLFELTYLAGAVFHRPRHASTVVGVIPGLGSGLAAALHARVLRAPWAERPRLVVIVQDLAGQGLRQSGLSTNRSLASAAMKVEGFALRRADTVIAISQAFVPELVALGIDPARIAVLPNWARVPVTPPSNPPHETCRPSLIVHAGSMGIKQGLDQVIEAARIARQEDRNWRFLLVGDGSERARLEGQARDLDNLQFMDPVPEADFSGLLASASVLILSQAASNIDMSFPSKLTAYFAAQRPVVACVPPGGSVDRFLRSTGTGATVPSANAAELVRMVSEVLDRPGLQATFLQNARRHLEDHWDQSRALDAWRETILRGEGPMSGSIGSQPLDQLSAGTSS